MKLLFLTISCAFFFSGCLINKNNDNSYKLAYMHSTSITDFNELTKDLLNDIYPTIIEIKERNQVISPLYVTDFANLSQLENKSTLGFILSDELKTNVSQMCNWPIYAIEFTKYLKMGQSGTKLLSREINDLKYTQMNTKTYGLVGTYSLTQRQLILQLKLINLNNGVILKSSSKRIELTDEIIELEAKRKPKPAAVYRPVIL